jgi:hypothetical protein
MIQFYRILMWGDVKTNDKKSMAIIQTLTRAAFNNIPARDSSKYKYKKRRYSQYMNKVRILYEHDKEMK